MKINWHEVTTFSKALAFTIFIIFPFAAFYLGIQYQRLVDRANKNIQQQNFASETASLNNPASYIVEVNQTGGIGSHVFTANVQSDTGNWLVPAKSFVHVSFKSPGELNPFGGEPYWVGSSDSMWVGCKDGYILTNAQSPTGNQFDTYLIGIPQMMVGMEIVYPLDNTIEITCEKE